MMELDDWPHAYRDKLAPCHSACGLARSGQGREKYLRLQTNINIPRPSDIPTYAGSKQHTTQFYKGNNNPSSMFVS